MVCTFVHSRAQDTDRLSELQQIACLGATTFKQSPTDKSGFDCLMLSGSTCFDCLVVFTACSLGLLRPFVCNTFKGHVASQKQLLVQLGQRWKKAND